MLAALAAVASCGGHEIVDYVRTADAGAAGNASAALRDATPSEASESSAASPSIGTAVVKNGGDPSAFKYSHAILALLPKAAALMLFVTDRPRTCADHLAGVDHVGEQDIYFPVMWRNRDGPVTGTWHFTADSDGAPPPPGTPSVQAWFFEHRTCGQAGTPWGETWFVDDVNYLTLSKASPSRVSGNFIAQMGFNVAGWDGPDVMYLEGSFDTVPCVVTSLNPPDPTIPWATLPSTTCP